MERATPRISWFERLTSRFIPAATLQEGGERLHRSRLVARICVFLILLSIAPTTFTLVRGEYSFLALNLSLNLAFLGVLQLLRRGVRAETLALAVVGSSYAGFLWAAVVLGGIASPSIHILLCVPLLAWFLIGRRAGLALTVLICVTFVALAVYGAEHGRVVFDRTATLVIVTMIFALVVNAFERGSQEARRELDEANAELMATNADLVAARAAAERALEARSAVLAAVSHEVRTPMSGILGVTDLLLHTELSAQQREHVDLIRRSGEAIVVITNDVLELSKLEANKMVLEHVELDVVRVVREVLSLMRAQADAKGLQVASMMDVQSSQLYLGDPGRLRQVLLNLVSNAIKFTQEGMIEVRVLIDVRSAAADYVRFEVRDTGIGLTKAQQAVIFEAFAQAETSTARRFGGTGLGLAICRNLVKLMSGDLRVESTPGRGSTFRFTIPLAPARPRADDTARNLESPTLSGDASSVFGRAAPLTVLLVEDDLISRKVVTSLLERLGCQVHPAESGEQAVSAVAGGEYDVVFMDCELPGGINGFEATARIRALAEPACHTAIIAMTGHAMQGDRERCLEAGMTDYLSKPIRRRALIAALRPFLRERPVDPTWDTLS
jgi:signal transduction histidine kinase/ActR/RegA family two-component response regulator